MKWYGTGWRRGKVDVYSYGRKNQWYRGINNNYYHTLFNEYNLEGKRSSRIARNNLWFVTSVKVWWSFSYDTVYKNNSRSMDTKFYNRLN